MLDESEFSIRTGKIRTFGAVDYVLFSLVLLFSAAVGMFYAYKDRKNVTSR
jgi:hypothetical protein